MSMVVKALITEELRDRYADVDSVCVVDVAGMNVQEQQRLRRALRGESGRLEVVKNSLARRALEGGRLAPLGEALDGPCALVVSPQSLIGVAKVLVAEAKELEHLTLKEAIFAGDPILLMVTDVAKMKSRDELIAELSGLVGAPGRAIAGCLASPQSKIAGCLKALVDKAA